MSFMPPNWRELESMEDAARRLIGVMDERAKKRTASGGRRGPEKFTEPRQQVPACREDGGSPELNGLGMLDGLPLTPQPGEASGDHATPAREGAGGWEYGGRAARGFEAISFSFEDTAGRARPVTPDETGCGDRARTRHSGGLK